MPCVKWTNAEVFQMINMIEDDIQSYTSGKKTEFYDKASKLLQTKDAGQVKSKLQWLESMYKTWASKLKKSGYGVSVEDAEMCDATKMMSIRGK